MCSHAPIAAGGLGELRFLSHGQPVEAAARELSSTALFVASVSNP